MIQLAAMTAGAIAGYIPHALFGSHISITTDYILGTIVGGAAYVFVVYKLRRMREGY